ncbi:hypothetical protein [Angustibacter speluncae]
MRPARPPWWQRVPGWVLALLVYGATRVVSTAFTLAAGPSQQANLWAPQDDPPYGDFVSMWDGDRYRVIAEDGYPHPLPVDEAGEPTQSEWAFFPAYPALVRVVQAVLGLVLPGDVGFRTVAPTVSLLCGFAAAVVVFHLFRTRATTGEALLGVALVGSFPTAAVLQYSYSEALCLLALAASLLLLTTRRYVAVLPAVALLGLTRPVGLAFGLVVLVHLVVRWRHRHDDPFPLRQALQVVLVGAVTGAAALAMPVATGLAAGRPDGYTAVQVAWRVQDHMEWFTPWAWMADYVFGDDGPLFLALLVVAVVGVLASPSARALGLEMWTWCAAYALYLAAVLDPFTSLPRFLLLFFPLALALVLTLTGWRRYVLVAAWLALSLWAQWEWVRVLWVFNPPSDYPP